MEYMDDFFIQTAASPWWEYLLIISAVVLVGVGVGATIGSDGDIGEIKFCATLGATLAGFAAIFTAAIGAVSTPSHDTAASASSLGESVQEAYGLELTDGVLELLVESVDSPEAVVEGEVVRFGTVEVAAADGSSVVIQLTWHGSGWVLTAEDGDPLEPEGGWS